MAQPSEIDKKHEHFFWTHEHEALWIEITGSGVPLHVDARRIRLWHEPAEIAEDREGPQQKRKVVDFLEANHVRGVTRDLLEDPERARGPGQSEVGAAREVVVFRSKGYTINGILS